MNHKPVLAVAAISLAVSMLGACATITTSDVRPSVSHSAEAGTEAAAWEAWDKFGGASLLRMDPSRPFKVVYVGSATNYPSPVTEYDAVIPSVDGKWYVFRAEYTK